MIENCLKLTKLLILGEKPYCCLVCPRAFNQRVVLREHIRSHHSAPDPVHGTTLTPYYCSLCGDLFAVSLDLIHHLIEHSDRSTAAKRVQPTGPRKYKRRRKLNGDSDNSDFVTVEANFKAQKTIKQEPMDTDVKKPNIFDDIFEISNDVCEFHLPDEIFEGVGKRVPIMKEEKKTPAKAMGIADSRPKMIYTQKTRVPVSEGKRKTKTMIQKQVVQSKAKPRTNRQSLIKEKERFEHDESSETWSNDDPNEDVLDTLLKRERKLSEKFTIDLVNDLQDILRSPLKTNEEKHHDGDEELCETNTKKPRRVNSKFSKKRPRDESLDDEKVFVKQEVLEDGHTCGMCGDSFETRAQLRSHIQIHI